MRSPPEAQQTTDRTVNHLDIAQAFVEKCVTGAPVSELAASFQGSIERVGFRYFACCSHVDPLKPPPRAVMLHNYPQEWARAFSELNFHEIDPVFQHASRTLAPFFWDAKSFHSELSPIQQEIFAEAARLGIAHGYTIPIHAPGPARRFRASCSVVPDLNAIEPDSYFVVQLMALHMYEAASAHAQSDETATATPNLSPRERQCLELVGLGKTDWVVGRLLGISERTVHAHIESAKRRLGVSTRMQAVIQALASEQIALGDVMRPEREVRPGKGERASKKAREVEQSLPLQRMQFHSDNQADRPNSRTAPDAARLPQSRSG